MAAAEQVQRWATLQEKFQELRGAMVEQPLEQTAARLLELMAETRRLQDAQAVRAEWLVRFVGGRGW